MHATARRGLPDIYGLEDFWARNTGRARPAPMSMADRVLLCVLGLGIEQGLMHLNRNRPDWDAFTAWVLDEAGPPDPLAVRRYHAWLFEQPEPKSVRAALKKVEDAPDAIDAAGLAHWQEHGYVIVREAIPRAAAEAAAALLWHRVDARPDDPDSWYNPAARGLWVPLYHAPELAVARRSLRVRKAFAQLWGTADLWMITDRTSFNPPERPGFPFEGYKLHWDVSLATPIPFATQGILYLSDTAADQGALRVVPGFHHGIAQWLDGLGGRDPREEDLSAQAVTVPAQAGDLILWRQDLPHGASPNHGRAPRLAQYVNMFSAAMEERSEWR
ncbi:phytanoyl-CoA dioxygenase family protein [Sphingomonas canadensis]|uniref:Phytanoyl-CoA dioxygenase family protein n=1 Tax=Sphingomonas canadensis TaxID=1219257 RepID=A0ABW3H6K6_9SPHN|nr:phytanoyl-CoA dioxygenase family protein [Sphingomonas canadensis]MCW3836147.1 phytanoyl-CoA dioxygenase family protein [Sphingomonas canadensis]